MENLQELNKKVEQLTNENSFLKNQLAETELSRQAMEKVAQEHINKYVDHTKQVIKLSNIITEKNKEIEEGKKPKNEIK